MLLGGKFGFSYYFCKALLAVKIYLYLPFLLDIEPHFMLVPNLKLLEILKSWEGQLLFLDHPLPVLNLELPSKLRYIIPSADVATNVLPLLQDLLICFLMFAVIECIGRIVCSKSQLKSNIYRVISPIKTVYSIFLFDSPDLVLAFSAMLSHSSRFGA